MRHSFALKAESYELWLSPGQRDYRLHLGGEVIAPVAFSHHLGGSGILEIASETVPVRFAIDGDVLHLHVRGRTHILRYRDRLSEFDLSEVLASHDAARAPMPGVVVAINVSRGDAVSRGATLMLVESMKLEFVVRAPRGGVVDRVHFEVGQSFEQGAALVTFSDEGR
ncbi:acetyl-CoA carboxylase biotin carboxyl carrier protein subunit [Bradyrhizobium sp. DASA03076]|uniref:acetyl-CoA carboxylase biotin carboxyl carrier protein subunit n=1 Tax=Bradyrhizobium sp. BLXBL-03 TaxID=3395916 RepID=UPI003F705530